MGIFWVIVQLFVIDSMDMYSENTNYVLLVQGIVRYVAGYVHDQIVKCNVDQEGNI